LLPCWKSSMNCLTYTNTLRKMRMLLNDAVIGLTRQEALLTLSARFVDLAKATNAISTSAALSHWYFFNDKSDSALVQPRELGTPHISVPIWHTNGEALDKC
jgi:hypothetical protein